MADYSEHEKLAKISDQSHACGEFLDWLGSKGIFLGRYREWSDFLQPVHESKVDLLAEFFEIDQKKLEEEKRAMIEECRMMQPANREDLING